MHYETCIWDSDAGTRGPGGATGPPIFGRLVNPIPTMGGRFYSTHPLLLAPPFFSPSGITELSIFYDCETHCTSLIRKYFTANMLDDSLDTVMWLQKWIWGSPVTSNNRNFSTAEF